MFYRVTAYGGSLQALRYFADNKITFKFGELEKMVTEYLKNNNRYRNKKLKRMKK